ncbi:hypothetical protein [Aquisphaera insulae]|uniref:hypothetical protein n=1 Tax=Aquisphaera insulae TaxID=2712864 RepID=UPI0013EAA328|nr:hypothetical protein [Aquisphaera insulae]
MRFGKWRGVPLAITLAAVLGLGISRARGDGWHTMPREVPAYDYSTGGEYFAPPVPYGHYAKDYHAEAAKALGTVTGPIHGLFGKAAGLFHGHDGDGHGHGHGGCGDGGCGHGLGCGAGAGHGAGGCGFCLGKGLFHGDGCGSGLGGKGCGLFGKGGDGLACGDPVTVTGSGHKKHFAPCHASTVAATGQSAAPAPVPTSQTVAPSGQSACGDPGCKVGGIHSHLGNLLNKLHCKFCGGRGCGGCGGFGIGTACDACGGNGCNACGGCGLLKKLCGLCGGKGCGSCGGSGLCGRTCGLCGGKGCANCLKGLASKAHGLLGSALGLFHHDKFEYFVGPGGPVPLRPGYVPYIVTTRSPRDYFAFPPMNPDVP